MSSQNHTPFDIKPRVFPWNISLHLTMAMLLMGMLMLPPVTISLPFKLIFFVLVDGWYLVAGSLVRSFGGS